MRARPMSLRKTITLALIVKLILLALLWKAFFSTPPSKHMRLPTSAVTEHLLAAPPPPSDPLTKDQHESPR